MTQTASKNHIIISSLAEAFETIPKLIGQKKIFTRDDISEFKKTESRKTNRKEEKMEGRINKNVLRDQHLLKIRN